MALDELITHDLPRLGSLPRVLMIDDSRAEADRVSALLEDSGGRFEWCDTAERAVEAVARESFDVALVAYCLGATCGLELIRTLSARAPGMALIVLTDGSGADVDLAAMEAGASGYLTKEGLDADELQRSMRYAMARVGERIRLARLARRDALTGLYNRAGLAHRLRRAKDAVISGNAQLLGVAMVDLDGFKAVNDQLGHERGDRLLVAVAERLRKEVRPYDTVARVGGDEFVLLLEDLSDAAEAASIAGRLVEAVADACSSGDLGGTVTASIGVTLFSGGAETEAELLATADAAMYAAKRQGKNRAYVEGGAATGRVRPPSTAQEIHEAIAAGTLDLVYQPQVDLRTTELTGLEALVRWRAPDGGPFDAAAFIAQLERTDAISELDLWVLGAACQQVGPQLGLRVAVNLSPRTLLHDDLLERLSRFRSGVEVEVELTEQWSGHDPQAVTRRLRILQDLGYRVALDDFGTGASSLARLSHSPVDTLKIDRSFVAGIDGAPRNQSIVRAVALLAELEGLHVVAEGVETEAEHSTLRALGVRHGQGFFFGDPMRLNVLKEWTARRAAPASLLPAVG